MECFKLQFTNDSLLKGEYQNCKSCIEFVNIKEVEHSGEQKLEFSVYGTKQQLNLTCFKQHKLYNKFKCFHSKYNFLKCQIAKLLKQLEVARCPHSNLLALRSQIPPL